MPLLVIMSQPRVFRIISKYVGIRNGVSCVYTSLSHFIFYNRISVELLQNKVEEFINRRINMLPPLPCIRTLKRQTARLIQPDFIYAPRQTAAYELCKLYN